MTALPNNPSISYTMGPHPDNSYAVFIALLGTTTPAIVSLSVNPSDFHEDLSLEVHTTNAVIQLYKHVELGMAGGATPEALEGSPGVFVEYRHNASEACLELHFSGNVSKEIALCETTGLMEMLPLLKTYVADSLLDMVTKAHA